MQIQIQDNILSKNKKIKAENILKSCVHCGFCLSACPTYKILGDEQNSPRGRIYTIKAMLEGEKYSSENLDKCLTCRSCETTCPSGVEYANLLEIGRELAYENKSIFYKTPRFILRKALTTPLLVNLASKKSTKITQQKYQKNVLLHQGCVQKPLAPNINTSTIKVLNNLGYGAFETLQKECCGAIDLHNGGFDDGIIRIKKNIDKWLKQLENYEVIISTASGCGVTIKDYPQHFEKSDEYFAKAQIVAEKTVDIAEFLVDKDLSNLQKQEVKIAYHEPCTLQHGQQLQGLTQKVLTKIGYQVKTINDNNLCCGSAGTYAIFQPKLAKKLRDNKINNLGECEVIATSNIGCLKHLQSGTKTPVKHWIELLT